jgi:hypothetical protein
MVESDCVKGMAVKVPGSTRRHSAGEGKGCKNMAKRVVRKGIRRRIVKAKPNPTLTLRHEVLHRRRVHRGVWILEEGKPKRVSAAGLGRNTLMVRARRNAAWRAWEGELFETSADAAAALAKDGKRVRYYVESDGEVSAHRERVLPNGTVVWVDAMGGRSWRERFLLTRAKALRAALAATNSELKDLQKAVARAKSRLARLEHGELPKV